MKSERRVSAPLSVLVHADSTKLPPVLVDRATGALATRRDDAAQTPNDLLLRHLLEAVSELHEREVLLTDAECEELLVLIKRRDRDTTRWGWGGVESGGGGPGGRGELAPLAGEVTQRPGSGLRA